MKKFKILLLTILLVGFTAGCYDKKENIPKTKEEIVEPQDALYKDQLLSVMNSKEKFINMNNEKLLFNEHKVVENEVALPSEYGFVDMDKDGYDELVVLTTSDYGAYIILHYKNEEIYGYQIDLRALQSLKTDGSFMGSSGASISDYSYMSFEENNYTIDAEAKYDAINENYYINNKTVTKEEIDTYIKDFELKENLKFTKVK